MIGAELLVWLVVVVIALLFVVAFWAIVAGDTEDGMKDEEPTLDVQNHRGD